MSPRYEEGKEGKEEERRKSPSFLLRLLVILVIHTVNLLLRILHLLHQRYMGCYRLVISCVTAVAIPLSSQLLIVDVVNADCKERREIRH